MKDDILTIKKKKRFAEDHIWTERKEQDNLVKENLYYVPSKYKIEHT